MKSATRTGRLAMRVSLSLLALFVATVTFVSCASHAASPGAPALERGTPEDGMDTLHSLQSSFHRISESVAPSVVQIDVRERVSESGDRSGMPFFDFFFGSPDESEPGDQGFERGGTGSGVIVSADRRTYYVLTNDHVVGGADFITVVLNDGSEFDAELVGRDPRKDLAMVGFSSERDLPVAQLGDSNALRVGDWVVAIGSPFGYQNTITVGVVSALGRQGGPEENISDFIQTDASINQGNSGGALVNLDGEVVGINTWITSDTGGSIGLGFAIPINNVRRSVDQFLSGGDVEYGWLGVSIQTITAEQMEALGLPSRAGALVDGVFADSPAAENGIRAGDFIFMIDGAPVRNSDELVLIVGEIPVDETVTFGIIRDGEATSIDVTLARRQANAAISQSYRQLWPGFVVYPLTADLIEEAGLGMEDGIIVTVVETGTAADIGGLSRYDIITSINGEPVADLLSFYELVADSSLKEWRLAGVRDGEHFEVTVVR